ncbi:MAG TPA: hypothetical protein VGF87_10670 [Acidimicrobiales bacterium]
MIAVSGSAGHEQLVQAGINPTSGRVMWQHPYSMSDITAGVSPEPVAIGTTVIDLVPSGKPTNPIVNLEGVDATSGHVLWKANQFDISDDPSTCPGNKDFCIVGFNPDGTSTLVQISPSGHVGNFLNGPNRSFWTGLYETDAKTPTLEAVSSSAKAVWTKTVTSLFGPGYDPDYGWEMAVVGNELVGTVAHTPTGKTENLAEEKTIGVNPLLGTTQWSLPGDYQCVGTLAFLDTQVVCQFQGTYTESDSAAENVRQSSIVLAGFNPATGAVTWSQPVRNASGYQGTGSLPFLDATSMVVTLRSGARVVLNTQTGATSPVTKNELFWCVSLPSFDSGASKGVTSDGERSSGPVFSGCTATGKAAGQTPITTPDTVGAVVDGVFLWPTSHGLGARHLGGVAT